MGEISKSFKLLIVCYWNNITIMSIIVKKSVFIVLAMLQFLSPLVHAHTGDDHFNRGFHIPGLESYLDNQDAASFNNVNSSWHSEGLLVLVDAGIKNPLDMTVQNIESNDYIAIKSYFPVQKLSAHENNFSPQEHYLKLPRHSFPPQSPRAPPLNQLT